MLNIMVVKLGYVILNILNHFAWLSSAQKKQTDACGDANLYFQFMALLNKKAYSVIISFGGDFI